MRPPSWIPLSLLSFALLAAAAGSTSPPAATVTLEAGLTTLIQKHRLERAHVGVAVYALTQRRWVLEHNADRLFTPASNQKLLTSWAALVRLGAEFRFVTELFLYEGGLWVKGSGDPWLEPSALAEALARARPDVRRLRALGFDLSRFDTTTWGPGWAWDGPNPVVLALSFPQLELHGLSPFDFEGIVETLGRLMEDALRAQGIEVPEAATPQVGRVPEGAVKVAEVRSLPLRVVLRAMNYPSDNFMAEMLFKATGWRAFGRGTFATGAQAVRQSLRGVLDEDEWAAVTVADGSGLSRYNAVSPRGLVRLLTAAYERFGDAFVGALPPWGAGTLAQRRDELPVRAKTGTLRGVSALSGYLWRARVDEGEPWAFSILIQGATDVPRARSFQDELLRELHRAYAQGQPPEGM